jgi:ABC-2 type transport system ATP-binding protein
LDDAIRAIELTKYYGSVKAVDHVNFEVRKGEIFGFLGPNGAGKTTTIKMLATLLKPTEGTAIVSGYDIVREAKKVRQSIGVVPQEYTADEDLTGWENIILIADMYGIKREISRERAKELLNMVGLSNAMNRKVSTYSGGMRRRLEIAIGLINRPSILFLDEPTLGLDAQTRVAIWSYLMDLKKMYNMTISVTTHYLEEADFYCNRIAIIDKGKIVKIGSPRELKESIKGDIITLELMDTLKALSILKRIDGVIEIKEENNLLRIKVSNGSEIAPKILEALNSVGIYVTRISITQPTLDEAYMEYTGKSLREEQASSEEMFAMMRTLRRARS